MSWGFKKQPWAFIIYASWDRTVFYLNHIIGLFSEQIEATAKKSYELLKEASHLVFGEFGSFNKSSS